VKIAIGDLFIRVTEMKMVKNHKSQSEIIPTKNV